jgi:peptidyl-prolyl cis-trans isomerase B (cyclophilin B)
MRKIKVLLYQIHTFLTLSLIFTMTQAQTTVEFETTSGSFRILLYEDTPKHKENFVKLVNEGYYDSLLFHRVIPGFMVQTGDPNSRNAPAGVNLGTGGPSYTLPAEINAAYFHKRGALAAARLPDQVNPDKNSSGSQFYVVQGRTFSASELKSLEKSGRHAAFTNDQLEVYTTAGGAPHLDNAYTIFGEVTEGMDVIDSIAEVPADAYNRPINNVRIIRATVVLN